MFLKFHLWKFLYLYINYDNENFIYWGEGG